MCGIVGFTGINRASDILINGLQSLEYRGYDSAGIALVQAWLELEKPELEAMIAKSVLPMELYRYGRPPLLSTRAEIAAGHRMSDLRGETFFVERNGLLTQIMAEKVMSIPSVRGAAAGLYDLRHANLNETNTARFNFDFRLE